jgi:peroxidase
MKRFRTFDGSDNNLDQADLNAAGTDFARLGPAHFADGVDAPVDGPNPRMISNVVVGAGDADVENPEGLSGMMYAWGQFIDHDLDLSPTDGVNHIDVAVPPGDPNFPAGTVIAVTRALIDPASGHDAAHPAIATNAITGWLDASMIYGSDAATAASLRLADGHMKTSSGGNLPIVDGMFAAGDVRAAENPSLTALQTLFVREHNFQVDLLHKEHPHWGGDELYQEARSIVIAEIEHITYDEFLPHLLGPNALALYRGYDASVDPRISVEFAGAAYRFGHSIVSGETEKLGELGQTLEASRELKDVFFEPPAQFSANSGADGILRHLAADASQALDVHIVDDLRNFLADPPDAQDLAAINIERARDLGLGTLNETRIALGLKPYTDFAQLTSDAATAADLAKAYGSVDKVDLWAGGLSEDHAPGAFVGSTFQAIIAGQFERLRDGDRFWFENHQFNAKTLAQIEHATLSDIIERDTDTKHMQDDAFVFFDRHGGTASGITADHPDAPQLVIGANGSDTLIGGPQGDVLVAGKGSQTMTGGAGDDDFVFGRGTNARITDFTPGHDKLEFDRAAGLDLRDVHVHFEQGAVVVEVAGDRIELAGLHRGQLSAHDFVFHS